MNNIRDSQDTTECVNICKMRVLKGKEREKKRKKGYLKKQRLETSQVDEKH